MSGVAQGSDYRIVRRTRPFLINTDKLAEPEQGTHLPYCDENLSDFFVLVRVDVRCCLFVSLVNDFIESSMRSVFVWAWK